LQLFDGTNVPLSSALATADHHHTGLLHASSVSSPLSHDIHHHLIPVESSLAVGIAERQEVGDESSSSHFANNCFLGGQESPLQQLTQPDPRRELELADALANLGMGENVSLVSDGSFM
jgi:hypothetical protein